MSHLVGISFWVVGFLLTITSFLLTTPAVILPCMCVYVYTSGCLKHLGTYPLDLLLHTALSLLKLGVKFSKCFSRASCEGLGAAVSMQFSVPSHSVIEKDCHFNPDLKPKGFAQSCSETRKLCNHVMMQTKARR